jgi:hypothetical protein
LSVGGAEASQNGLGDLIPTKSFLRSAMDASFVTGSGGQRRVD